MNERSAKYARSADPTVNAMFIISAPTSCEPSTRTPVGLSGSGTPLLQEEETMRRRVADPADPPMAPPRKAAVAPVSMGSAAGSLRAMMRSSGTSVAGEMRSGAVVGGAGGSCVVGVPGAVVCGGGVRGWVVPGVVEGGMVACGVAGVSVGGAGAGAGEAVVEVGVLGASVGEGGRVAEGDVGEGVVGVRVTGASVAGADVAGGRVAGGRVVGAPVSGADVSGEGVAGA